MSYYLRQEVLAYIRKTLPKGSTILELGSGTGTGWLAEDYKMYSIEDKKKFVGRENSTYIYAPLKEYKIPKFPSQTHWYDAGVLEEEMPKEYDMILVDGPSGDIGRGGFAKFIHLFRDDVPILFDDLRRADDLNMAIRASHKLNRPLTIVTHGPGDRSWFGVCYPNTSNGDFL